MAENVAPTLPTFRPATPRGPLPASGRTPPSLRDRGEENRGPFRPVMTFQTAAPKILDSPAWAPITPRFSPAG
jgi:hypothetical protein